MSDKDMQCIKRCTQPMVCRWLQQGGTCGRQRFWVAGKQVGESIECVINCPEGRKLEEDRDGQ